MQQTRRDLLPISLAWQPWTAVANHLVQTVEASRLLGADVIVTGRSPEMSDADMRQFREALLDRVVTSRAHAVIIDVMAMDVLDSFATRTLREIAYMTKLRGAKTVLVGVHQRWLLRWCSWAAP